METKGETAAALAQRRQALALEPNNALLHFNLGADLEDAGQSAAARTEYLAALHLQPNFPEAQEALHEGSPDPKGQGTPRPDLFARPLAPRPGISQALALEAGGNLKEAIAVFRAILVQTPHEPSARLHLGIALYADGQRPSARREWQRVLILGDAEAARQARRLLARYP